MQTASENITQQTRLLHISQANFGNYKYTANIPFKYIKCILQCFDTLGWCLQCEWKNPPPPKFFWYFSKQLGTFVQILRVCFTFPSTLDYKFLFNYLQLRGSYAILSATTQFTSYAQNVHHRPKRTLAFSDIFPKQLEIFSPNFTRV